MTDLSPAQKITLDRLKSAGGRVAWHSLHHIAAQSLVDMGLAETGTDDDGVKVFWAKEN